jgi:DNA-binding transcriptional ArsR family regulator
MSSVLTGNLAYVEVINILKLLASGEKDGKLILQTEDNRKSGEIFLAGGRVVHAICDEYLGEAAFRDLVLWQSGKFAFEPGSTTTQKTIEKDTAQLLSESTALFQSWQKIHHLIPSVHIKFKQTGQEPHGAVKLKSKDWEILNALSDGEHSVAELTQKMNMREMDVASILSTLVEAGVVEPGEESKPVRKEIVDEKFFKVVENELIQLIGPVASIIMDDVIEGFGESRGAFPKDKVAALVEGISNEIYDPAKQVSFQKFMFKQIKSL